MMHRRVVNGFKLPEYHPPTENELTWIEFLRIISNGTDPGFDLAASQMLQQFFRRGAS